MTTITRFGTGSGKQNFVSQGSKAIAYAFTAGKHGIVSGSIYGTTVSVVDSSSTAWTVVKVADAGPNLVFVAYRENMPSGITSVTPTSDNSGAYGAVWVDEWSGVATSSSQDGSAVTAVNNTTPVNSLATGNLTATDPNCLIYAVGSGDDGSNTAWNTSLAGGWTEIGQEPDTTSSHAAQVLYTIASGSTGPFARTFSYPPGDSQMCTLLVAFKPAAGGAPDQPPAADQVEAEADDGEWWLWGVSSALGPDAAPGATALPPGDDLTWFDDPDLDDLVIDDYANDVDPMQPPDDAWPWDDVLLEDDQQSFDGPPAAADAVQASAPQPPDDAWCWDDLADDGADASADAPTVGADVAAAVAGLLADAWNWDESADDDGDLAAPAGVLGADALVLDATFDDPWPWDDGADAAWPEVVDDAELAADAAPAVDGLTADAWPWDDALDDGIESVADGQPVATDDPVPVDAWSWDDAADGWPESADDATVPADAAAAPPDMPPAEAWAWDEAGDGSHEEPGASAPVTTDAGVAPADAPAQDGWYWNDSADEAANQDVFDSCPVGTDAVVIPITTPPAWIVEMDSPVRAGTLIDTTRRTGTLNARPRRVGGRIIKP